VAQVTWRRQHSSLDGQRSGMGQQLVTGKGKAAAEKEKDYCTP
jgi:hypothetical protein